MRGTKLTIDQVVARNIARLQRQYGLSVKDLAVRAGIALTDLQQLLRAETSAFSGELERLATALHATESQLVERRSTRAKTSGVSPRPTPRKSSSARRQGRQRGRRK